jgi:hypothetical protein
MKKWIYKHYKQKLYEVIWIVLHTETREKLVLYKALYKTPELKGEFWNEPLFVRPYDMFNGNIEVDWKIVKRFEFVWENKEVE